MKMLESKLESATQAVHESDAVDIVCEILSQLSSQPFSTEEKQEKEGKEENKGNKGKESNKSLPSSASQTLKPKSKSSNKSGAGVANANDDSGGYHDLIIMRRRALVTAHSVHTGAGEIEMTSSSSDDDDNDNNHRGGEDSNNKISYSSHNTRLGYNEEDDDYGSESYTVVKMRKRI